MKKLFLFLCLIAMIGLNSCMSYAQCGRYSYGRPCYRPCPRYYAPRGYVYNRYPANNYGRRMYGGYRGRPYNGGQYQGQVSPYNIQLSVPVVPGAYMGPRRR